MTDGMELIAPACGLIGLIYGMWRASMLDWLQVQIGPRPTNAYRTPVLYGERRVSGAAGIGDGTTVALAQGGFSGTNIRAECEYIMAGARENCFSLGNTGESQ